MQIQDSIAIVTGANRGLGKSFVEALINRGAARIYAGARNPDTLKPLLKAHGDRIIAIKLDVTSDEDVNAAAQQAGDVNLLINNAGVLESLGLMEAGELAPLKREMDVNVFGLARMALAFAPVLTANGGGAMLNILSAASLVAFPAFGSYAASKAAAMSLTHSLGYELQGQNITVHGLYAGYIDTGMIEYVEDDKTSPDDIVAAGLDGIEAGVMTIDADERSRAVRKALQEDPAGLIQSSWDRTDEFRKVHPAKRPTR